MPALCKADIEALLATRPVARTARFVLHARAVGPVATDLSTVAAPSRSGSVDNLSLATVVPKRHARRAVTRNLIKREARTLLRRCAWPPSQCVIRLRGPIDARAFPSAASQALRLSVRQELRALLEQWAPAGSDR